MTITTEAKQQALDFLIKAEEFLNDALVELTEDAFEEEPEIDNARADVLDVIARLEGELK